MPSEFSEDFLKRANDPKRRLRTTQLDPRFPNTNQAQHCWTRYNEWIVCLQKDDEDTCAPMRQLSRSICPDEWIEKWDDERDEGKFAGVQS